MKTASLALLFLSVVSATYFEVKNTGCGTDGPVIDAVFTCASSGENACVYGDTVSVTGTLTIPSEGLGNVVRLTNKVCLLGIKTAVTCKEHSKLVNLCSLLNLEQDGCPAAGDYNLNTEFTFPKSMGGVDLGSWIDTYVVVYTTITSEDEGADGSNDYACNTRVNVHTGDASATSGSAYMLGFSVVMLAGLGALVYKRRRTAKIDLTKEEAMLGDFEMMNDTVRV